MFYPGKFASRKNWTKPHFQVPKLYIGLTTIKRNKNVIQGSVWSNDIIYQNQREKWFEQVNKNIWICTKSASEGIPTKTRERSIWKKKVQGIQDSISTKIHKLATSISCKWESWIPNITKKQPQLTQEMDRLNHIPNEPTFIRRS